MENLPPAPSFWSTDSCQCTWNPRTPSTCTNKTSSDSEESQSSRQRVSTLRAATSCSEMWALCQVQQGKKTRLIFCSDSCSGLQTKKNLGSHWKMILNGYWLQKVERVTACNPCDPKLGFGFVLRHNCCKLSQKSTSWFEERKWTPASKCNPTPQKGALLTKWV